MAHHDYASVGFGYLADAEEKVKEGTQSSKLEAAHLYLGAAKTFAYAGMYTESAKAYSECAGQHIDIDNFHQAAALFSEAGYMYAKEDPNAAVLAYNRAIDIFTDREKYYFAGKRCIFLAEIYEKLKEMDKATEYYMKAAKYYAKGNSPVRSLKSREDMARISANSENYKNAVEIYEEAAKAYIRNEYMEHHAKGSYLRAAICGMCMDKTKAAAALDKYKKDYPALEKTKEYRFIKELLKACDEHNVDKLILSHQHDIYLDDPAVQGLLLKVQN